MSQKQSDGLKDHIFIAHPARLNPWIGFLDCDWCAAKRSKWMDGRAVVSGFNKLKK